MVRVSSRPAARTRPASPGHMASAATMANGYSTTVGKTSGADERGDRTAEGTADRHHQVELGEVARRRAALGQAAVAEQRGEEEPDEVQHDDRDQGP